ncbi:MAG: hypothetical protein EA418_08220 [Wenzhouxiangellaceae bacterium]|nr:MAG: hypothetical protein EA418_08220 [Wenzhouxiangellaceae bacterium]
MSLLLSLPLMLLLILATAWVIWRQRTRRAWRRESRLDFETVSTPKTLIAHACGGSAIGSYPNALESLDQWHAMGVRYFEFDLQPTPDGSWIGLHDWGPTLMRWFDLSGLPLKEQMLAALQPRRALSSGLMTSLRMRGDLTVITLRRLRAWLQVHPEAWLVTDIKQDNAAGLQDLARALGPLVQRVVAQVFTIEEIGLARRLGYGRVAWANYVPRWPLNALPAGLAGQHLDLVVLDQRRLRSGTDEPHLQALINQGFAIWVFTVNDRQRMEALPECVTGVITDCLVPGPDGH